MMALSIPLRKRGDIFLLSDAAWPAFARNRIILKRKGRHENMKQLLSPQPQMILSRMIPGPWPDRPAQILEQSARLSGWAIRPESPAALRMLEAFEQRLARMGGGVGLLGCTGGPMGAFCLRHGYRLAHRVAEVQAGEPLNPGWPVVALRHQGNRWLLLLAAGSDPLPEPERILRCCDLYEKRIAAK